MASKAQMSGMRGVYLVAAELARLGFIASPTSRSAQGADILVTDQRCQRAYSVQVKTKTRPDTFWLLKKDTKKQVSKSHLFVFVNIKNTKGTEEVQFFPVPSRIVASRMVGARGRFPNIKRDRLFEFRNKWSCFGKAL